MLDRLKKVGYRATLDARDDKISYKVREAQLMKVPYMLVCGQKEMETGMVAIRTREGGDQGTWSLDRVMEEFKTLDSVEF